MFLILSIAIWIGISSLAYFLCFVFFDSLPHYFIFFDAFLLAACLLPVLFCQQQSQSEKKASLILTVSFYLLLILNVFSFLFQSLREPHGGWDGWAIWNMHARFFFRSGFHWRDFLTPLIDWVHPDYPWLVPASIARFWGYLGKETSWIPILVAFFFTFGTVGLLVLSLKKIQDKNQAFLAGTVLMGIPFFLEVGWSQMADVPISFYILATFCFLAFYDLSEEKKAVFLVFAGLFAGLACWTKNEGLLFLAALCFSRMVIKFRVQEKKEGLREWLFFSVGFFPILVVLFYFKIALAPPNFHLPHQGWSSFGGLLDFSRYVQILEAFYKELGYRIWNWFPLFLVFYAFVVGVKVEEKLKWFTVGTFLTMGVMLVGYFFMFLISPLELTNMLQNTLNRLLLQLWPAFLFNYFLLVPVPSDILQSPRFWGQDSTGLRKPKTDSLQS